jgi:Protein of unknown function (DUF2971)
MEKEFIVFCLCADGDNPLLWAHYAESHTGVSIRFDTQADPMRNAVRVIYSEKYPVHDRLGLDADDLHEKTCLMKSTHWKYENEFRLFQFRALGRPWPDFEIRFTTPDPKVGVLGAEAVRSCAMPESYPTAVPQARPSIPQCVESRRPLRPRKQISQMPRKRSRSKRMMPA